MPPVQQNNMLSQNPNPRISVSMPRFPMNQHATKNTASNSSASSDEEEAEFMDDNDMMFSHPSKSESNSKIKTKKMPATGSLANGATATKTSVMAQLWESLRNQSLDFAINGECTSLCLSPSGLFVWAGFSDGTIRVFDLTGRFLGLPDQQQQAQQPSCTDFNDSEQDDQDDHELDPASSATSKKKRHHRVRAKMTMYVNSQQHQSYGAVACQIHARGVHTDLLTTVDASQNFVFGGVQRGATELYAIDTSALEQAALAKEPPRKNILDYLQVYCYSDAKLKGFGACTQLSLSSPSQASQRPTYLLLTGKGIKNIHIWKFQPPVKGDDGEPVWEQLYDTQTNGNTISLLSFYRTSTSKLYGISQSDGQKLRLWDLSCEEQVVPDLNHKRPKRPPYQDVVNSQGALGVLAGGFCVCGGPTMYNQFSIVSLHQPKSAYNHTELALPTSSSNSNHFDTSNRQRRGDLKQVVRVASLSQDVQKHSVAFQKHTARSSHEAALLELDDGSLVHYAGSEDPQKRHGQSQLSIVTPESTGLPSLPADHWRRNLCLGHIQSSSSTSTSQGVVVAAMTMYNPNTQTGNLVVRTLQQDLPPLSPIAADADALIACMQAPHTEQGAVNKKSGEPLKKKLKKKRKEVSGNRLDMPDDRPSSGKKLNDTTKSKLLVSNQDIPAHDDQKVIPVSKQKTLKISMPEKSKAPSSIAERPKTHAKVLNLEVEPATKIIPPSTQSSASSPGTTPNQQLAVSLSSMTQTSPPQARNPPATSSPPAGATMVPPSSTKSVPRNHDHTDTAHPGANDDSVVRNADNNDGAWSSPQVVVSPERRRGISPSPPGSSRQSHGGSYCSNDEDSKSHTKPIGAMDKFVLPVRVFGSLSEVDDKKQQSKPEDPATSVSRSTPSTQKPMKKPGNHLEVGSKISKAPVRATSSKILEGTKKESSKPSHTGSFKPSKSEVPTTSSRAYYSGECKEERKRKKKLELKLKKTNARIQSARFATSDATTSKIAETKRESSKTKTDQLKYCVSKSVECKTRKRSRDETLKIASGKRHSMRPPPKVLVPAKASEPLMHDEAVIANILVEFKSPTTKAKASSTSTHREDQTQVTGSPSSIGSSVASPSHPQAPRKTSGDEDVRERIVAEYQRLRQVLDSLPTRKVSTLLDSRRKELGWLCAENPRTRVLSEHRATHERIRKQLLQSAENILRFLLNSEITIEGARAELSATIRSHEEIVYDTITRQEFETDAFTTGAFSESETPLTEVSFPFQAAFQLVHGICKAIEPPRRLPGRPKSTTGPSVAPG